MLKRSHVFIWVVVLIFALSGSLVTEGGNLGKIWSKVGLSGIAIRREAKAETPTLLVIPARYTIVKFSFDVARLRRAVSLVSYSGEVEATPLMHVWRSDAQEWVKMSIEEYRSADAFKIRPQRIILVGGDKVLPSSLIEASTWCSDVKRIPTLNIMALVNALNEDLKFHSLEWRWLAMRYELKLKDLNAERRRYGRYGKPGPKREVPVPPVRSVAEEIPLEEVKPETVEPDFKEPEWERILPEEK